MSAVGFSKDPSLKTVVSINVQHVANVDEEDKENYKNIQQDDIAYTLHGPGDSHESSTSDALPLDNRPNNLTMPSEKEDPWKVHWDGINDPENPWNWSKRRRWGMTILVSTLAFNVYVIPAAASYSYGLKRL